MIAKDAKTYEAMAVDFTSNPAALAALRNKLAGVMSSPLFDAALSASYDAAVNVLRNAVATLHRIVTTCTTCHASLPMHS